MFRLIQEAITRMSVEGMSNKDKNGDDTETLKGLTEEQSSVEIIAKLRNQIGEQEKEISEFRRLSIKQEKRNKNLKESIDKLIEEKRQIDELSKIIDEQKEKIDAYEKEINDLKIPVKAEDEKPVPEKRSSLSQGSKSKSNDSQVLSKQIELLSSKSLELKAELDRRSRISDMMKREHEAALRDRNDLLAEVKSLKRQVDEMKHRLDRSLALLVRKKKGFKESEDTSATTSSIPILHQDSLPSDNTKGTQTQEDKNPSKTVSNNSNNQNKILHQDSLPSKNTNNTKGTQAPEDNNPTKTVSNNNNNQNKKGGSSLNSVGLSKDSSKKSRIPRPRKSSGNTGPSIQSSTIKDSTDVPEKKVSDVVVSDSIQEVKGKRVVSDIRSKLEKKKNDKEYPINSDYGATPTSLDSLALIESTNTVGVSDHVMDLFEVVDEDSSSPRRI